MRAMRPHAIYADRSHQLRNKIKTIMKSYTKSQALHILNNFQHIIGRPMDEEVNISRIFAYPITMDEAVILETKILAHVAVQSAPESALFYVKALSEDLVQRQGSERIPLILREPIETYLSDLEMEEVLSH